MSEESANKLLYRFQLAKVVSLPYPLLQCLQHEDNSEKSGQRATELIATDLSLYAKILGAYHHRLTENFTDPEFLLRSVGRQNIDALISNSVFHAALAKISGARLNFLKLSWRQTYLTSMIAKGIAQEISYPDVQKASFCGLFANFGELVLDTVFPSKYRSLHETASNETELLALELATFGTGHAELGSVLLREWGLENFVCDAVRYHHEPLKLVLNASDLVKITWLAGYMARHLIPAEGMFDKGRDLLSIEKEKLLQIHETGHEALLEKTGVLEIKLASETRLPLEYQEVSTITSHDESKRALLAESAKYQSLFNTIRGKFSCATDQQELGEAIHHGLGLLFGLAEFMFFGYDKDKKNLSPYAGSCALSALNEVAMPAIEGSSIIARCFVTGDEQASFLGNGAVTVIDRQILSLLNRPHMFCEPIVFQKEVVAVLVLGIHRDQIGRYIQEEKLRRSFKTELANSIKEIAATSDTDLNQLQQQKIREVIHEVNNPLSIIKNYLKLLSMKLEDESAVVEEINVIKSEIDRVGSILAKLSDDDRDEDKLSNIDVNKVLQNLCKVFSASFCSQKELSVSLNLDPGLAMVSSNENTIKQIVTNLLKNAAEALSEKGNILLETHDRIFMDGNQYFEIKVKDDGPGVPPEILDNLFLPGNSTKRGAHSGSGLAIVKKLVEKMHGKVSCQSDKHGASFSVLLPKIRL